VVVAVHKQTVHRQIFQVRMDLAEVQNADHLVLVPYNRLVEQWRIHPLDSYRHVPGGRHLEVVGILQDQGLLGVVDPPSDGPYHFRRVGSVASAHRTMTWRRCLSKSIIAIITPAGRVLVCQCNNHCVLLVVSFVSFRFVFPL
jgi:hypothetical protein